MSILIKGMGMPVTCCHFPLMGYDPDIEWVDGGRETQGAYICVITHELIDNTKREEHCPLFPVPPHGRLGDLDALAQQIEHERFNHTHTDGLAARHHVAEYGHFLKAISDAPTIIPACEEVYGKYVDTAGNLRWTGTYSGEHVIPAEPAEEEKS